VSATRPYTVPTPVDVELLALLTDLLTGEPFHKAG
jgi:hypothetical protein